MPTLRSRLTGLLLAMAMTMLAQADSLFAQGFVVEQTAENMVRVRTRCIMPEALQNGYLPVEIEVFSLAKGQIALNLALGDLYDWGNRAVTTGSIVLEPGETKRISWLVYITEASRRNNTRLSITIPEGELIGMDVYQADASIERSTLGQATPALAVSNNPVEFARKINGKATVNNMVAATGCEPIHLPTDWRAYSTLTYVVLDLSSTPPDAAQLEAILAWVTTGGTLLLAGTDLQAQQLFVDHEHLPDYDTLITPPPPLELNKLHTFRHGFGRIQLAKGEIEFDDVLLPRLDDSSLFLPGPGKEQSDDDDVAIASTFSPTLLGIKLRIPGLNNTPAPLLILVLLVFVLLIGPVQFFMQRRKGVSPFRFLFVTPILGIGCSLLILVASLVSQGISVKESLYSVTWLNQETHQATTLAKRYTFSGSLFPGSLKYSGQTLAVSEMPRGHSDKTKFFRLNMNQGGRLEGDYLPIRFPTPQAIATVTTSRGKIEFEVEDDLYYAVNGLDVVVDELTYRSSTQRFYAMPAGEKLSPGSRVALEMVTKLAQVKMPKIKHTRNDNSRLLPLGYSGSTSPPPPSGPISISSFSAMNSKPFYLAKIATTPYVEDGGISRDIMDQTNILVGFLGEDSP